MIVQAAGVVVATPMISRTEPRPEELPDQFAVQTVLTGVISSRRKAPAHVLEHFCLELLHDLMVVGFKVLAGIRGGMCSGGEKDEDE